MTLGDLTRREALWMFGAMAIGTRLAQSRYIEETDIERSGAQTGYDIRVEKAVILDEAGCVNWTPYGRLLVTNFGIRTLDPDGEHPKEIIPGSGQFCYNSANMSPDGKRLVFTRSESTLGITDICTANADGTDFKVVRTMNGYAFDPVWFPDNNGLLFEYARNGQQRFYTINADGTGLERVTNSEAQERVHALSPDGRTIAYDNHKDMCLMDVKGGNFRVIARAIGPLDGPAHIRYFAPSWSPDGEKIACTVTEGELCELAVMDKDGSHKQKITETEYAEGNAPMRHLNPVWGPDGTMIACNYSRDNLSPQIKVLHVKQYQRSWLCH